MKASAPLALAATVFLCAAQPAQAQSVYGAWARDDGLVRSRIGPCGRQICATNIWVKDPQGPEKAGDRLQMTLKEQRPGHWSGSAFDPQRNLTYDMTLTVDGRRMSTSGCVLGGLLCKAAGWRLVSR
jgi:uncharacterized protein (DUF2147 family)